MTHTMLMHSLMDNSAPGSKKFKLVVHKRTPKMIVISVYSKLRFTKVKIYNGHEIKHFIFI